MHVATDVARFLLRQSCTVLLFAQQQLVQRLSHSYDRPTAAVHDARPVLPHLDLGGSRNSTPDRRPWSRRSEAPLEDLQLGFGTETTEEVAKSPLG